MSRWLLMLVVVTACSYDDQDESEVALGDQARFAANVQSVVGPRCATLDCHGDATRPLALFAENGLRLTAELRGQPLADEELSANVVAMSLIDPEADPEDSLVVRKPLAVAGGGMKHEGGDVWDTMSDPAHVCLLGWLEGDASSTVDQACADARPED